MTGGLEKPSRPRMLQTRVSIGVKKVGAMIMAVERALRLRTSIRFGVASGSFDKDPFKEAATVIDAAARFQRRSRTIVQRTLGFFNTTTWYSAHSRCCLHKIRINRLTIPSPRDCGTLCALGSPNRLRRPESTTTSVSSSE